MENAVVTDGRRGTVEDRPLQQLVDLQEQRYELAEIVGDDDLPRRRGGGHRVVEERHMKFTCSEGGFEQLALGNCILEEHSGIVIRNCHPKLPS